MVRAESPFPGKVYHSLVGLKKNVGTGIIPIMVSVKERMKGDRYTRDGGRESVLLRRPQGHLLPAFTIVNEEAA